MTKKSTKLKATVSTPRRSTKGRAPSVLTHTNPQPEFAQGVVSKAQGVWTSEEEALGCLISSITEKLGDEGMEGSQMREFLSLILDTDPTLKAEILQGISLRK
jgi:hypothetical protein